MAVACGISSVSCGSARQRSSTCSKKKEPAVKQVNERLLHTLAPPQVDVILRQVDAAEMDEMWSFVGSKSQQRWLWHAIDHHTGQILADLHPGHFFVSHCE